MSSKLTADEENNFVSKKRGMEIGKAHREREPRVESRESRVESRDLHFQFLYSILPSNWAPSKTSPVSTADDYFMGS